MTYVHVGLTGPTRNNLQNTGGDPIVGAEEKLWVKTSGGALLCEIKYE